VSRWSGRHGKGARQQLRKQKRAEAEARNEQVPVERTRRFRRTVDALTGLNNKGAA
jgi:hypothetical protein